jgi:hypothetical protein
MTLEFQNIARERGFLHLAKSLANFVLILKGKLSDFF